MIGIWARTPTRAQTPAGCDRPGLRPAASVAIWHRQSEAALDRLAQRIVELAAIPADAGFHDRVDQLRTFINNHSDHWNDPVAIMNAVIAHAEGAAPRPAALECNRRSALLDRTARQFGYRSRYIWIYHSRRNRDSHTFLEILKGSVGTLGQVQKSNCRDGFFDILGERPHTRVETASAGR